MTPLDADTAKFLTLLLSECEGGPETHKWRTCRRCLAMHKLAARHKLARKFIQHAINWLAPPTDQAGVVHDSKEK